MFGWTAREVDQLSLWEFQAACDAWVVAHSDAKAQAPTPEEHDYLVEKYAHLQWLN